MGLSTFLQKYVWPGIAMIGILLLWEVIVRVLDVPLWLLPPPTKVLESLDEWYGVLPYHIWLTFFETMVGFVAAVVLGLSLIHI